MRERPWPAKSSDRHNGRRSQGRRERHHGEQSDTVILYGWHTVTAALANPARRFRKLLATENALRRLADEGITPPLPPEIVRPDALAARLTPDAVHQGLLAEADPLPSPDIEDLPANGIVLVLDQITDPHNVGAILRTAAAFAVAAVVTTARHSPEATGVLAKSASGALELVPIAIVQNLARALAAMKERGFLVVGLDGNAPDDLAAVELRAPLALVLGAVTLWAHRWNQSATAHWFAAKQSMARTATIRLLSDMAAHVGASSVRPYREDLIKIFEHRAWNMGRAQQQGERRIRFPALSGGR